MFNKDYTIDVYHHFNAISVSRSDLRLPVLVTLDFLWFGEMVWRRYWRVPPAHVRQQQHHDNLGGRLSHQLDKGNLAMSTKQSVLQNRNYPSGKTGSLCASILIVIYH